VILVFCTSQVSAGKIVSAMTCTVSTWDGRLTLLTYTSLNVVDLGSVPDLLCVHAIEYLRMTTEFRLLFDDRCDLIMTLCQL